MNTAHPMTRLALASVAGAVVVGAGGLVAVDAASADSAKPVHTIKLHLTQTGDRKLGTSEAGSDRAATPAGKPAGYVVVEYGGTGGHAALALKGGLLYATLDYHPKTGAITGPITGGTGTFAGVTGTFATKNLDKSGTRTAITIRYH